MKTLLSSVVCFFITLSPFASAQQAIEDILSSPMRSESDKKADLARKPSEFVEFLDVQPEMTLLDVFSGAGYYTEIVAKIVGPSGHVDAHNNQAYVDFVGAETLSQRYQNNRLPNVAKLIQEANALMLKPNHYDRVLLVLSFHDLFYVDVKNGWPAIDAEKFMRTIGTALKKDGAIGIIDHLAKESSEIDTAQSLHRIDLAIIKQKMREWDYELVAEADYLRNQDDPQTTPMWEESVRGKTDRAVLKFRYAGQ